ncbi:DeoR/GlpR family DNA-binding transcription regulator [Solirubrobacter ginsenosidimutans]|uniref:Lactose phosphotransferase system repressor n=1 Tax=Solirubrobacter ginsenosidimutans TaxID=490573 RepID=A0A9X3MZB5_9ACTN|nr:DeoR/GlpR family DNA-binding transcription regulator [Solirubrobacter ginsenosidimutans]MDA0164411.1 DeoR/GlpR family DNA-binding transcription regulator [Solirubrobacter ginsenosidimutans]
MVDEFGPLQLSEARREAIRKLLMESGAVTTRELQARFGVSPITVRRDLEALEQRGTARRTHGGAVLPSVAIPDGSFTQRIERATDAKLRLAEAACNMLSGGETVFLDSSTTAYFIARRITQGSLSLRVITNSGPVMQLLASSEESNVDLYAIGGMLRRLTGSYVGPSSVRMIRDLWADRVFLGVTGVTAGGMLTDTDQLEASVKLAMLEQARESVLLVDASKFAKYGRQAIASLDAVSLVLADGLGDEELDRLRLKGVAVQLVDTPASRRFKARTTTDD